MKDLHKIFKEVAYQKTQLQFKGIEAKYLFLDKTTYNELKNNAMKIMETPYLSGIDRFMGLTVMIVSTTDEFISVGV